MPSFSVACLLALNALVGVGALPHIPRSNRLRPRNSSWVPGKAFDRIAIIWLENTDYDKAVGDPNLAWLAARGITLDSYHAVTHPSQPNYLAAISGDYQGMNHDDLSNFPSNVSTVLDLLEAKGISWGEYQEDMPYTGFTGFEYLNQVNGANDYVRKHNPAVSFENINLHEERLAKIKNTTLFWEDLEADALPQWMFITPNMTSDGHDSSVTVAGTWTRTFLEPLLNNTKFMKNTLVLVTFDENETYTIQNRVLAILLGDAVPAELVGTTDSNFYDHYSEIATVEANWGLDTLGRFDVGANVFSLVAEKTGDTLREWSGATSLDQHFFNYSYPGYFNDISGKNRSFIAPNVNAEYAGRQVHPSIVETWKDSSLPMYYGTDLEIPDGYNLPEAEGY
ncbi:phosphoesterase-like protein [Phyllosticta citricarpa]|uniref:Phosphoesterase-like protein n=1 Tax=Phyllosticta citricarpa TaxID=55181 RepID=A0ABR1LQW9_9PEZI